LSAPPIVRFATADDVPRLAALEAESFSDPWAEDSVAAEVEGPGTLVLAAVDRLASPPIAYAAYRALGGEAELLRLAVAPAARRRGVARTLLAAGRRHLAGFGCQTCFLEVRSDNVAAIALYEAEGFHPVGRRAGYYGRDSDAIVYAASLLPRLAPSGAGAGHRRRPPPGG
jgi:[ribosomal protein S18]-alanine N-acetyltransferase